MEPKNTDSIRFDEPAIQASPESIAKLTWQGFNSLSLALMAGALLATPAIYHSVTHRFKSYTETTYLVGNSPHEEARVTQWANSIPGVDKFICERRDGDLWVRWEYRGFVPPEAVRNAPAHLRELGYDFRGMRGGGAGAVPREFGGLITDVLTDAQTLATILFGTQLSLGVMGLWRIRAAAKKGQPLAPLLTRRYAQAAATGALAGLVLFGIGSLYTVTLRFWLGDSTSSPWDAAESMPLATRAVFLLFGAIGAPVAEEIFFRGYLFGTFKRAGHVLAGIVISAGLFAAAHFSDLFNVPAVFLYGLLLAWVYHRTGSLVSSIVGHAVNNGLAIVLMFL